MVEFLTDDIFFENGMITENSDDSMSTSNDFKVMLDILFEKNKVFIDNKYYIKMIEEQQIIDYLNSNYTSKKRKYNKNKFKLKTD